MALFLIGSLNFLTATSSYAAITFASGFGVTAGADTFANCPSFCTGDSEFDSNGGPASSFASATSTRYGLSRAQAFYSSAKTYLPELKALSTSTAGQGGSASAFGVQGYAYEGTATTTLTIDFQLDANVFDSGTFGTESTSASIGVLGLSSVDPSMPVVGPVYYASFGTWYFENIGTRLGTDSLFVNTPNGSDTGSIMFTVNPGDVFFVGASLSASSRTGIADAFNTFTATFNNPTVASQLTIANATAVPEPSSLILLSVATGCFAALRRRRVVAVDSISSGG